MLISVAHVLNTLRPRQMDAISQTTFSNAFSSMKMFEFRLKLHWSLFPRVQLTIFQHWFRLWLGADQATSHYLNQWWLDYRRIYASLGLSELINPLRAKFFRGNINIYLHFMSSLHIDLTQVLKILPQVREGRNILYSQYHCCWCPGDVRSQAISSHDIDLVKPS